MSRFFSMIPVAGVTIAVFVAWYLVRRKEPRPPPPQSWDRLEHPD